MVVLLAKAFAEKFNIPQVYSSVEELLNVEGLGKKRLEEILDLSEPTPSPDLIRKFVAQIVPEGKTNFQWHLNLDGNQTTHVGMTVEGRKNKAVVSFAAEGTCSPLYFLGADKVTLYFLPSNTNSNSRWGFKMLTSTPTAFAKTSIR